MVKITKNLCVGNDLDCQRSGMGMAIIHACKTCHQIGVGYKGSLPSGNPNYLIFEKGLHLYLNMVDMDQELLPKYTNPIMRAAVDFIKRHIDNKIVLVHCNQGHSRSPSIGLLYLARKSIINQSSYKDAAFDFTRIYPDYQPGKGIESYLLRNWRNLTQEEVYVEH
jgi:hypothetical protein